MGRIQKGTSGNPNGRPKGAVNKVNRDVKAVITKVVEGRLQELDDDLDSMSPFSKWTILLNVMKYAYPTLSAQKIEADINTSGKIEFTIKYDNQLPPAKDNNIIDI